MPTPLWEVEHARSIVANRGQWVEPLDWRELELILDVVEHKCLSTFEED